MTLSRDTSIIKYVNVCEPELVVPVCVSECKCVNTNLHVVIVAFCILIGYI